jgi:hypothetical protein
MKYENFFYELYNKNVHSQNGEDGVIEELLKRLNLEDKWCCEFGAWDGKNASNTLKLVKEGFNSVMIEGDESKFIELLETSKEYPNIIPINKYVDLNNNSLDKILSETTIPEEFTLLSIDTDSEDYKYWDSLKNYKPIIVIIEINSGINPIKNYQNNDNNDKEFNTSFYAMYNLGKKKGYEFVCHTGNMIFVRKEFYPILGIESPENPTFNFKHDWIKDNKDEYSQFLSNE